MRYVFLIPTQVVTRVFKSTILFQEKKGISHVQDNNLCSTFSGVIPRNAWRQCALHQNKECTVRGWTLTDKQSCRWIHQRICNPVYRGPPALGKAPISTLSTRTLTVICKSTRTHAFTQVCMCRRWSFTTLSRSLNVGHARMRLKDDDNPDMVQCWQRSLMFLERMNDWTGQKYVIQSPYIC